MTIPRPAPPEGSPTWLDHVLSDGDAPPSRILARCRAELSDLRGHLKQQQDNVLALMQERDSLRVQVAELRRAVLGLGILDFARAGECQVPVSWWNVFIRRLRESLAQQEDKK